MSFYSILVVLLCFAIVKGALPEFDDPIHGRLIQSRKHPLFLTHKLQPELAFYVPTDQQFATLNRSITILSNRLNRSSYLTDSNGSVPTRKRFARSLSGGLGGGPGEFGSGGITMSPEEFKENMQTFTFYTVFVGRVITTIFHGYLDIMPKEKSKIAFSDFNEKTHFKETIVEVDDMNEWLENLDDALEMHRIARPYFPVEQVMAELRMCRYVGQTDVSDYDFQFSSSDGGSLTYYKVHCVKFRNRMFIFFALSDTSFTLKSVKVQRTTISTLMERRCYFLCWIETFRPVLFSHIVEDEEKRVPTGTEMEELKEYMVDKVIQQIKREYSGQITAFKQHGDPLVPTGHRTRKMRL